MTKVFDDAYARYLASLARLDTTLDISEKNSLFKQLTEQLSELERTIKSDGSVEGEEESEDFRD